MIPCAQARLSLRAVATLSRELELNEVLRILNSKLAGVPMVERFELAPTRDDAHHREYHAQIRAVLRDRSTGVEFRYEMKLADSGCAGFEDLAWDILGRAHKHHTDDPYADLGEAARRALGAIMSAATAGPLPPPLATVGLAYNFHHEEPLPTVDLEMLGNNLRTGIERTTSRELEYVTRDVGVLVRAHQTRVDAAERARRAGAVGWITQAALRIVDAAGVERRTAIEAVHAHGDVGLSFATSDGGRLHGNLRHDDGVIVGSIIPRDRRWNLRCDDLVMWGKDLPDVIRGSLEGRRLGDLFQSKVIPQDAVIVSVEEVTSVDPDDDGDDEIDGWLRLGLEVPMLEIDDRTGEVRERPGTMPRSGARRPRSASSFTEGDDTGEKG